MRQSKRMVCAQLQAHTTGTQKYQDRRKLQFVFKEDYFEDSNPRISGEIKLKDKGEVVASWSLLSLSYALSHSLQCQELKAISLIASVNKVVLDEGLLFVTTVHLGARTLQRAAYS